MVGSVVRRHLVLTSGLYAHKQTCLYTSHKCAEIYERAHVFPYLTTKSPSLNIETNTCMTQSINTVYVMTVALYRNTKTSVGITMKRTHLIVLLWAFAASRTAWDQESGSYEVSKPGG